MKKPNLLERWRERNLPPAGPLANDGWWVWHRNDDGACVIIDTWVTGFSPGEVDALGGYHTVRVFRNLDPEEGYFASMDVYDDRPEDDVLELVETRNEQGQWIDYPVPEWLQRRIIASLPEWQGEEEASGPGLSPRVPSRRT